MRGRVNGWGLNVLGWATTICMFAAAAAVLLFWSMSAEPAESWER